MCCQHTVCRRRCQSLAGGGLAAYLPGNAVSPRLARRNHVPPHRRRHLLPELKEAPPATRLEQRQAQAAPVAAKLHEWLVLHRIKVPDGTAIAKAIDYSLNRWVALTRYLADPALPIDNNHDEQQIRPWATGRKNWLFAGTQLAGQRAAAVMSLIQSAKLNGLDPYAYLRDVLTRLPTHKASRISELLPHRWASLRAG